MINNSIIDKTSVKLLLKDSPDNDFFLYKSSFFKAFSDITRLKIIYALSKYKMCVTDLCAYLDMEQSAVSHQLRILRQEKLIKFDKRGKLSYYYLSDNIAREILNIVN